MLQEKIQLDLKNAIINKDESRKSLLRVVIGEFNREGKILNDDLVIRILKKLKENAEIMNNQDEIKILDEYLPTYLDEVKTKQIILDIIRENNFSGLNNIGKVIASVKNSDYSNLVDYKIVSTIAKELLK